MRSLIVSDLHLGGLTEVDLLARADVRRALLAQLDGIDRLILLGDVLELRHGPPHAALAASRAFFEDVGRAFEKRELMVVPGNHDHLLVSGWLDARACLQPEPQRLELEQRLAPEQASEMLAQIARWARPARVQVAYPGLWVRPDVYATHGHYLDCHLTVPTLERLGVGAVGRLLERDEDALRTVEDYEALTAPIYAWRDMMARYANTGPALNGLATVRAWRALGGAASTAPDPSAPDSSDRGGARGAGAAALWTAVASLRGRALRGAFPLAVEAVNRARIGPVRADISGTELRRAGLRAMGEVASRLGVGEAYVVFGHTHRAGPLPGDEPSEWRAGPPACATRLVNCGSWVYDSVFSDPAAGQSPYWPGTCVLVDEAGPPTVKRLLQDRSHVELAPDTSARREMAAAEASTSHPA